MDPIYLFRFFLFSQLVLLLFAGVGIGKQGKCSSSFNCGSLGTIYFPFTTIEHQDCGLVAIQGCDDPSSSKMIQLEKDGRFFEVIKVSSKQDNSIVIFDKNLQKHLLSRSCEVFHNNFTLPLPLTTPMASFYFRNKTFYRCDRTVNVSLSPWTHNYTCPPYEIVEGFPESNSSFTSLKKCSMILLPVHHWRDIQPKEWQGPFNYLSANISIEVQLSDDCYSCHYQRGGKCRLDRKGNFYCAKERSRNLKLGLELGAGILSILIIIGCLILRRYKWNYTPSLGQLQARNTHSDPYSNPDPESGCVYFGVPLFSYKELQEATNNFDLARELGEGGFGIVYFGRLQDGREVAVKRLYEHNYRRVTLFMNEVEILTRLRHRNLVSLYGCTSFQSRELLLVYEYIPNGTLASHLHGNLAKFKLLPWAIRMKIAIETASALVYLHASDIIHRDVKTNNILLDNSYCVKVADFGLSRLFPNDVTHVSTAPQGTPGYVDPEYHRCYQLTSKSDVYSFGVVLIELTSSMSAVDLTRNKDEINLADLAMKKIKKRAFDDLVDPSLGFELDSRFKRMIHAVLELAFQCLQWDSELRPSMGKVLEVLKRIVSERDECDHEEELDVHGAENSHSNVHQQSPTSNDRDEDGLLKNVKLSSSPNMATDKWEIELTIPNNST